MSFPPPPITNSLKYPKNRNTLLLDFWLARSSPCTVLLIDGIVPSPQVPVNPLGDSSEALFFFFLAFPAVLGLGILAPKSELVDFQVLVNGFKLAGFIGLLRTAEADLGRFILAHWGIGSRLIPGIAGMEREFDGMRSMVVGGSGFFGWWWLVSVV